MRHPWLALFEAKRAFIQIGFNPDSGQYALTVTKETLAQ